MLSEQKQRFIWFFGNIAHSSMRHSGLARTARVIPPAYAYPTPLASPHDDTKPPSYSLVVEKPPVIFDPTGGDKEKVKY